MSIGWGAPESSPEDQNSYVHWWYYHYEDDPRGQLFTSISLVPPLWLDWFKRLEQIKLLSKSGVVAAKKEFGLVPIPKHAEGKEIDKIGNWYEQEFPTDPPDNLQEDLVIVGIIDTGITLGHRRFRRRDGSTRFLAAWQQTAEYKPGQPLPCGQELYARDIDRLLRDHSRGSLDGQLDEDAFNRAAHLVEPERVLGHRDLDYRAAHGTHVLDLATGFDPDSTDEAILNKYRIIAVNLPPQYVHGSAGNFLVFFSVFALERILCLADALWKKKHPDEVKAGIKGGYPAVVNFSYGMQAGPKDGSSLWELLVGEMIKERTRTTGGAPTRVVMPVGNDNAERGAAFALMGKGTWDGLEAQTKTCLPWRISPSDQTSNYVEIWASRVGNHGATPDLNKFTLFITPPGLLPLRVPTLAAGQHSDLGGYARVYCPHSLGDHPLRLVICVAPTLRYWGRLPAAPAGEWQIEVHYEEQVLADVAFYVQSDQSGMRHSTTGEQSYFDHPSFETYRENGRLRDSFDYETGENEEPWDEQGPVQRKGTHNALATCNEVTVVGGYRLTDGRPALYSATTNGDRWRDIGRQVIDGLYPTEDGPAHFGLLGAGSRDGSTVAFRGTSMAAAQATRDIAERLGECGPNGNNPCGDCGNSAWIRDRAAAYKDKKTRKRPDGYRDVHPLKGGPGHLPTPGSLAKPRLPRF